VPWAIPCVPLPTASVVYAGNGLAGYGELLIVKHSEQWLSAYGHNSALLVREGERVTAGQPIARMGLGPGRQPLLHFEVRRNGVPVDPAPLLPAR
jgi:lipoprotein NlpD